MARTTATATRENHSDNLGVEGPTDDPAIRAARGLRKRNLLATLMLSPGHADAAWRATRSATARAATTTPMRRTTRPAGSTGRRPTTGLAAFVARLTALRRTHPVLRQRRFLHARPRASDGLPDVIWRRPDGDVPRPEDWHDPAFRCLGVELRLAAEEDRADHEPIFAVFNAGAARDVVPAATPRQAGG